MKVLEKMESPGILRLGISAISSEKYLQNQDGFAGLFSKFNCGTQPGLNVYKSMDSIFVIRRLSAQPPGFCGFHF